MNKILHSTISIGSFSVSILLILILLLAAFMRLFRIGDYMTFLGDEGRDVLVAKHILEGDFTLLGPRSSAADFYYGPIYYYLITPFLWLFRYDPVGPAVFIAITGIAAVFLVYYVGKYFFGEKAGVIASLLYAVSPLVITYSRSSWNPNPLPLVSLLSLFVLYKGLQKKKWWYFALVGLLLGLALQMQYLALFLAIILAVYTFFGTLLEEKKKKIIVLIKRYLLMLGGFSTGFSPFFAFEVLHGFPNTQTIINYILGKYDTGEESPYEPGEQVSLTFIKLFGRLLLRMPNVSILNITEKPELQLMAVGILIFGILSIVSLVKLKDKLGQLLFLCWFLLGVGLFFVYKKDIYDYYLGLLFPLPFLLVGNLLSLPTKRTILKIFAGVVFILLLLWNLLGMPFLKQPNRQKDQVRTIAEFVLSKTDNKPYNFALITPGNSDHAYRYFFEVANKKPVVIENTIVDPERTTVTDQLLIVCEDVNCKPLGHPLFEVAGFGQADIAGSWDVSVVKVYKLVPYTGAE